MSGPSNEAAGGAANDDSATVRVVDADEIRPLLDVRRLIEPMADALRSLSRGEADAPVHVLHPTADSDLHLKSATLAGCPVFTVKMAGWSGALAAAGRPASGGLIAVFDAATCRPLVILQDDHLISDFRTAATGALAVRTLAPIGARTLAVLGTGVQAGMQARAAALVTPLDVIHLWGRRPEATHALAASLAVDLPDVRLVVHEGARSAVEAADIVVTTTSAKDPIVHGDWLRPGQHVTSVGSDDATKCELAPSVLARSDHVVVDSMDAAVRYGCTRRAMDAAGADAPIETVELGAVLDGAAAGRRNPEDITVACLVGLGIQDLAAVRVLLDEPGFGPYR